MADFTLMYRRPPASEPPVTFTVTLPDTEDAEFEFCNWVHDHLCPGERAKNAKKEGPCTGSTR